MEFEFDSFKVRIASDFFYSDSMYKTLELMDQFGGSFATALVNAYHRADISNRRKIFATWPELFQEYGPHGIFWGTEQKEES